MPLSPGVDAALPLATDDVSDGGGAVRPISGGEGEDSEEDERPDPTAEDAADAANAKGERAPMGSNAPPATPLRPDAVFAGVTGGSGMGVDRTAELATREPKKQEPLA
jgi:hypothetical protein